MSDLWSERTSLLQLSNQAQLELILAVRSRRREQRVAAAEKKRTPTVKAKPVKDPLSSLSMDQLLKLMEKASGSTIQPANGSS